VVKLGVNVAVFENTLVDVILLEIENEAVFENFDV
jgi:hypothetical protein